MDIFQGFITAFGFMFPPRDWTWCAGQLIAINDNPALYSLLGSFYGGDDRTVFGIPELRGRSPIGYGQSPGQPSYSMGMRLGATTNTLDIDQLPTHNHVASVGGGSAEIVGGLYASTGNAQSEVCSAGDYIATVNKTRAEKYKSFVPEAQKGQIEPLGGADFDVMYSNPDVAIAEAGGSQPFSVMQPVLVVNYSMAFQGLYPPRN